MRAIVPLLAAILITEVTSQTFFVHKDDIRKKEKSERRSSSRIARQTQTNADQMVQNILQWIQEVYSSKNRKARQQSTSRDYLPPSNTQRPRPFQPNSQLPGGFTGYPYPGSSPQPPFSEGPGTYPPQGGSDAGAEENGIFPESGYPPATYPPSRPQTTRYPPGTYPPATYPPSGPQTYPPSRPQTTRYPQQTTRYPQQTTRYPEPTQYPQTTRYTPPSTEYTSRPLETTGYTYTSRPAQPEYTTPSTVYTNPPTRPTGYPTRPSTYPTRPTTYPTRPTGYPTGRPSTEAPYTTRPSTTQYTTPGYQTNPTRPPYETERPGTYPTGPGEPGQPPTGSGGEDDESHPPHIHAIDVECAKDMMTINIEFNKVYNGLIYSKGHFNNPECRYVQENSNQIKYTFTVRLDSCGTEFINAFDTQGQSYLENVLVLQNEAGIQEAWDSIRSVRCLWEGNLKKTLNLALSVGMLQQEVVTFSGDTAMAKLDIQLGRGPFAPPATGLVKIGDIMTLVISVTGDPGFDIQVRDCQARDSEGATVYQLTDSNGCVLKPKVFGAFQKTRNTQNTGASIIAYAFFSAFKFPDVMDLILECNVELCKTDCEACPYPDQNIEPGGHSTSRRRRRDISFDYNAYNRTRVHPDAEFKIGRGLKVILPEDVSDTTLLLTPEQLNQVCVSMHTFVFASTTLLCLLTISCIFSAHIWLKLKRTTYK